MIRRLLRRLFHGYAQGGTLPPYRPRRDEQLVVPSPGGPDYDRIARLERELGIGDPEPEPERPMRRGPQVCLTKNCLGGTSDIRTWSGVLVRRIHECG